MPGLGPAGGISKQNDKRHTSGLEGVLINRDKEGRIRDDSCVRLDFGAVCCVLYKHVSPKVLLNSTHFA